MAKITDMTSGSPLRLILNFSFPLIISNLGQQLYMIADGAIVGRGVGVKAFAAVGATDWIVWLIIWSMTVLTQAFSTFVSRYFGEKNYERMNKVIAMSALLSAAIGIFMGICGMVTSKWLLTLLGTPDDIINDAVIYLVTMSAGTLIVTAYNMAASVLRALGDGKTPFFAMVIAAILNVGLDILFVMVLKWGVFGAALASVMAQAVSFVFCLIQITKIECVNITYNDLKPDFGMLGELFLFGIPLCLQYVIISVGGIILQSTINAQGSIYVAGYTAINKLYGLLESTAISLGIALSTFYAQNYGAGKNERVKKGVRTGAFLAIVLAVFVMILVLLFGRYMLMLFLDTDMEGGQEALEIGWNYLKLLAYGLVILYSVYVYRNVLQAVGISSWSLISGISEFFIRVIMGKVLVLYMGIDLLYYVEPVAWIGALVFVMLPYMCYYKKKYFTTNRCTEQSAREI